MRLQVPFLKNNQSAFLQDADGSPFLSITLPVEAKLYLHIEPTLNAVHECLDKTNSSHLKSCFAVLIIR
jgi:hypothetical protein